MGEKLTNQKLAIMSFLERSREHPNIEQVYEEVKKTLPRISLATVYRNLKTLLNDGIVKELKLEEGTRYDGNRLNHQHFICGDCGELLDVKMPATEETLKTELKNYSINDIKITVKGHCDSCIGRKK